MIRWHVKVLSSGEVVLQIRQCGQAVSYPYAPYSILLTTWHYVNWPEAVRHAQTGDEQ